MFYAVRLLNTLVPLVYAAAVAAYAFDFFGDRRQAAGVARRLIAVAVGLHAAFLLALSIHERHLPLSSPSELLTFIAFAMALVYVWLERRTGVERTGLFLVGMVLLVEILASSFLQTGTAFPAILESPLFALHVVSGVVGYAAFGVSAIYGVLYLALHRALKVAKFGLMFDRLPPLDVLARMSLGAVRVGVSFLTVTVLLGTGWALYAVPGSAADPKLLLTLGVWAGYLVALVLHRRLRWSERRTIAGFLVGFAFLVFAAVASRLVFETFHVFA